MLFLFTSVVISSHRLSSRTGGGRFIFGSSPPPPVTPLDASPAPDTSVMPASASLSGGSEAGFARSRDMRSSRTLACSSPGARAAVSSAAPSATRARTHGAAAAHAAAEGAARAHEHLLLLQGLVGIDSVGRRHHLGPGQLRQRQRPQHAAVAHAEEHLVVVLLDKLELVTGGPGCLRRRGLIAEVDRALRLARARARRGLVGHVAQRGAPGRGRGRGHAR